LMKTFFRRLKTVIRYIFGRIGGRVTPFINKLLRMYANAKKMRAIIVELEVWNANKWE